MILGLDHTGLAVHDLEAAGALFERLGFALSPREALMRPGPGGKPEPAGADNRVFMLERGYQELIAITDPSANHPLLPRLARYEGLHIVLLSTDDADADRAACAERAVAVSECTTWSREVTGVGTARFRFFFVFDAPECVMGVVQHLTPSVLRPPGTPLRHANGVWALNGCTLLVSNVTEASRRYARILGMTESQRFTFGNGTWLALGDAASLGREYPDARFPPAPAVAGVTFATSTPDDIGDAGLTVHGCPHGRWIAPQDAFGALLGFEHSP